MRGDSCMNNGNFIFEMSPESLHRARYVNNANPDTQEATDGVPTVSDTEIAFSPPTDEQLVSQHPEPDREDILMNIDSSSGSTEISGDEEKKYSPSEPEVGTYSNSEVAENVEAVSQSESEVLHVERVQPENSLHDPGMNSAEPDSVDMQLIRGVGAAVPEVLSEQGSIQTEGNPTESYTAEDTGTVPEGNPSVGGTDYEYTQVLHEQQVESPSLDGVTTGDILEKVPDPDISEYVKVDEVFESTTVEPTTSTTTTSTAPTTTSTPPTSQTARTVQKDNTHDLPKRQSMGPLSVSGSPREVRTNSTTTTTTIPTEAYIFHEDVDIPVSARLSGSTFDKETLLSPTGIVSALVGMILILVVFKRRSYGSNSGSQKCCCAKLVNNKRPSAISVIEPKSSGQPDLHMIHAIRHQLHSIHEELVRLKHERDAVDSELIETSTHILQSIGEQIRYGTPTESVGGTMTSSQLLRELEDTPAASVGVGKRQISANSVASNGTSNGVQAKPAAGPVLPPSAQNNISLEQPGPANVNLPRPSMISSNVHSQPTAPGIPKASPNPGPEVAAPKMSAIAAARMKREQETNVAHQPTQVSRPPANPFAKPKGPFGSQ
jgi:hypothetical protein